MTRRALLLLFILVDADQKWRQYPDGENCNDDGCDDGYSFKEHKRREEHRRRREK
jgi:hypothetical protein